MTLNYSISRAFFGGQPSIVMRCHTLWTGNPCRCAQSPKKRVSPLIVNSIPVLPFRVGGVSPLSAWATDHPKRSRELIVPAFSPSLSAQSLTVRLIPLRVKYRSDGRGLVPMISSGVHPRWRRSCKVLKGIPVSNDQSLSTWVRPPIVRKRLRLVLRICSAFVAHLQLLFVYGPSLFFRSMECLSDGGLPMSAKKFSNFRQRLLTVMPRPPYLSKESHFLFKTLWSIVAQIRYTRVPYIPCVVFFPKRKQPHDRAPLSLRRTFSLPHSQRQSQKVRRPRFSIKAVGVSNPILVG